MKIYTKSGMTSTFFKQEAYHVIEKLTEYEPSSIFWHDQHDHVIADVPFDEAFPKKALDHLRNDPTSVVLMYYGDEYYNLNDLTSWAKFIKKENIPANQVYIICLDENWKKWTLKHCSKLGIDGINVQAFNTLMMRVDIQDPQPINHKFSAFSRNYVKFRLEFFINLVNQNVLKNFDYTFNNIMPYGKIIEYPQSEIIEHVKELGYPVDKKIKRWIKHIPYTLETDGIVNKMAQDIYHKISSSAINVVIESHFNPFWNFKGDNTTSDFREFSPAFPTEKVYKAIGCNRPFIVVSTPEFLKEFRQLGYKTFHPYIDETYDTIENDKDRMQAIVNEVVRLSNLSTDEFNTVIKECEKIAMYNTTVLDNAQKNSVLDENFKWLEPIIDKSLKNKWHSKIRKEK